MSRTARTADPAQALDSILPLVRTSAYSAHQKARTTAARFIKQSAYDAAIEVLFESAKELLKAREWGSGTDLTSMLIDAYEKKGEKVDETSRSRLTQLIALTDSTGTWRKPLIDKAINWSSAAGTCPAGDPQLQHYVGELLYKEGAFDLAEPHLLASPSKDSARLLAQMMFEWSSSAPSAFPYAARGVIPYLMQANFSSAHTFLSHFLAALVSSRPGILNQPKPVQSGPDSIYVTNDVALNCLQLLVATCQRSADGVKERDAWRALTRRYLTVLGGKEMGESSRTLGEMYFNVKPPGGGSTNMMQEMMASLFGGAPPGAAKAGAKRSRVGGPAPAGAITEGLD